MRRKNENPINENWVKTETVKKYKEDAKKASKNWNESVKGKKQITVKHPTSPRAVIIKYVNI